MTAKAAARQLAREASAGRSIDEYPIELDAHHMSEIFGVSLKQIYKWDAAGKLLRFENLPRIGRKTWSRERVRARHTGENQRPKLQRAG